MRATFLTLPLLGLAGFGLSACQDSDQPLTEEQASICDSLNESIVELQKRHSAELGEAILMNQMRSQGQLDNPNLDPTALAQFSLLHYEARLGNALSLLEGNGCELPTEPVEGVAYSQAAGACLQARASGAANVETACNQDDWQENDNTAERPATPPVTPVPAEGAAADAEPDAVAE